MSRWIRQKLGGRRRRSLSTPGLARNGRNQKSLNPIVKSVLPKDLALLQRKSLLFWQPLNKGKDRGRTGAGWAALVEWVEGSAEESNFLLRNLVYIRKNRKGVSSWDAFSGWNDDFYKITLWIEYRMLERNYRPSFGRNFFPFSIACFSAGESSSPVWISSQSLESLLV